MKVRVLILCTGNSARSQMAEGLLRHLGNAAGDRFTVESAGTHPTHVRPEAIAAMRELGIDISARETCPIYPGHGARLHRSFDDPAAVQGGEEQRLAAFRRVRDQLRDYLRIFPPPPQATRNP